MTLRVRTATGTQTVQRVRVRGVGGLKAVKAIRFRDDDGLHLIYTGTTSLTLSIAPSLAYFISYGSPIVSGQIVATVGGGTAPLSYNWETVSYTGTYAPNFNSRTVSNPFVSMNVVTAGSEQTAVFRVTVTDALGASISGEVEATFAYDTIF